MAVREERNRVVSSRLPSVFRPTPVQKQAGQSLAELALVTPLLLTLLMGAIEIGRFAYYSIEVANAARAGVQYAAQSLADSKDSNRIQQASKNDAPTLTNLNVASRDLCACSNTPSSYVGCPAKRCSPGHPVVFVEVNTAGAFRPIFRYPGLPASFRVNGQATMRVAQ